MPRSGRLWRGWNVRYYARKQRAPLIHARVTVTLPSGRLYLTYATVLVRRVNRTWKRRIGRDNRLILIQTEVMNKGCLRGMRSRVFFAIFYETWLVVRAKANRDDSRSRRYEL